MFLYFMSHIVPKATQDSQRPEKFANLPVQGQNSRDGENASGDSSCR